MSRKNFKLPPEVFETKVKYLKYLLGFQKLSKEEVLNKIVAYVKVYFELGTVYNSAKYTDSIPKKNGFVTYQAKKDFWSYGGDLFDPLIAVSKLLGEYLERYEFMIFKFSPKTKNISLHDLRKLFDIKLHEDYHFKTKKQLDLYRELNISENDIFESVLVKDLVSGKKVLYPLQCFVYNRIFFTTEKNISDGNSNGSAAGFDIWMARCNALYEIIERESFMLFWYTKYKPQEIIVDESLDEKIRSKIAKIEKYGFQIRFFDITSDLGIPTVLCAVVDKYSEKFKITVHSRSSCDFHSALTGVLNEAYQMLNLFVDESKWAEIKFDPNNSFLSTDLLIVERLNVLYSENRHQSDFFLENSNKVNLKNLDFVKIDNSNLKNNFHSILNILKSKIEDLNIYEYKSINPHLRKIGFAVIKLYIPQIINIHFHERNATPFSKRVDQYRKYMDMKGEYIPNTHPHPFI